MEPKTFFLAFIVLNLLFSLTGGNPMCDQVWWERTGEKHDYDLSGYNFLILLGEDFDYHENMVLKKYWEDWGAKVEIAGTDRELTGHLWKQTDKGWDRSEETQIKTDLQLSEVDISQYQVLFFPGGNSPKSLLEKDSSLVVNIIKEAHEKGLVLAAICHGPQVLAAAGVLQGRKATGHPEITKDIQEAGGEFVNQVCVVDGNIITGNWPYFETMAVKVAEKLLYPDGGGPSEKSLFETNPVLKAIKDRRSIRRFEDKDVEQAKIDQILRAATWAPSANNDQPWKFVVVRNKETKEKVLNAFLDRMKDYFESHGIPLDRIKGFWSGIFAAPVHIFAFCDTGVVEIEEDFEEKQLLWSTQGVSAACQNMLLAAHALGLGSVWMGASLAVEDEIKEMLDVPPGVRLMTVIAMGYPAYEPLPPVRKPLSDVMFFEKWDKQ
jgi:nitroreductase/putative intracellular protease/amidase